MKCIAIALLFIAIAASPTFAQELEWAKFFGAENGYGYGFGAIPAIDGGFIAVGTSFANIDSFGNTRRLYVVRTRDDGTHEWSKLIGGDYTVTGRRIVAIGNRYLVACTNESRNGASHLVSIKWMSRSGDIEAEQRFANTFGLVDMIATADGGAVVACSSVVGTSVLRFDSNATFKWRQDHGSMPYPTGIDETLDGGFILSSTASATDGRLDLNTGDVRLLRLSSTGDSLWRKRIFTPVFESDPIVLQNPDGGLTIGGRIEGVGFMFKIGSADTILYHRTIDYGIGSRGVIDMVNYRGGVIVLGNFNSTTSGVLSAPILTRVSSEGDVVWQRKFDVIGRQTRAQSIHRMNGAFILGGVGSLEVTPNTNELMLTRISEPTSGVADQEWKTIERIDLR
ncbi:MAG: hypothetical protein H7X80_01535 [bacterium]|nr:hypothetical protein [Candidatus Kapabacteria bacterium]